MPNEPIKSCPAGANENWEVVPLNSEGPVTDPAQALYAYQTLAPGAPPAGLCRLGDEYVAVGSEIENFRRGPERPLTSDDPLIQDCFDKFKDRTIEACPPNWKGKAYALYPLITPAERRAGTPLTAQEAIRRFCEGAPTTPPEALCKTKDGNYDAVVLEYASHKEAGKLQAQDRAGVSIIPREERARLELLGFRAGLAAQEATLATHRGTRDGLLHQLEQYENNPVYRWFGQAGESALEFGAGTVIVGHGAYALVRWNLLKRLAFAFRVDEHLSAIMNDPNSCADLDARKKYNERNEGWKLLLKTLPYLLAAAALITGSAETYDALTESNLEKALKKMAEDKAQLDAAIEKLKAEQANQLPLNEVLVETAEIRFKLDAMAIEERLIAGQINFFQNMLPKDAGKAMFGTTAVGFGAGVGLVSLFYRRTLMRVLGYGPWLGRLEGDIDTQARQAALKAAGCKTEADETARRPNEIPAGPAEPWPRRPPLILPPDYTDPVVQERIEEINRRIRKTLGDILDVLIPPPETYTPEHAKIFATEFRKIFGLEDRDFDGVEDPKDLQKALLILKILCRSERDVRLAFVEALRSSMKIADQGDRHNFFQAHRQHSFLSAIVGSVFFGEVRDEALSLTVHFEGPKEIAERLVYVWKEGVDPADLYQWIIIAKRHGDLPAVEQWLSRFLEEEDLQALDKSEFELGLEFETGFPILERMLSSHTDEEPYRAALSVLRRREYKPLPENDPHTRSFAEFFYATQLRPISYAWNEDPSGTMIKGAAVLALMRLGWRMPAPVAAAEIPAVVEVSAVGRTLTPVADLTVSGTRVQTALTAPNSNFLTMPARVSRVTPLPSSPTISPMP